ncbi:MAG: replicative DNA helicase [Phocaeicola sp.]
MANNPLITNIEVEKLVLGTILNYPTELLAIEKHLSPECFYLSDYNQIYKAIIALRKKVSEINAITVFQELKVQGSNLEMYDVTQLLETKTFSDLTPYALLLQEKATQRACLPIASRLMDLTQRDVEDVSEEISKEINNLNDLLLSEKSGITSIDEAITELYENINLNLSSTGAITGTATGFERIDSKGGLQGSDLIIVAGETSQGKTSFANAICLNAIKNDVPIFYLSMEMTSKQLISRLAAMESGVPSNQLLYGRLTNDQISKFDKGVASLINKPLFFDDKNTATIDSIIASIRYMVAKHQVKGVIIDYLGLIKFAKGGTKEQAVGDAARDLKNLAKELDIWIIALSQLNRNKIEPQPTLDRLRDSGQVAEASDMILLVYRPEVHAKGYGEPYKNIDPHNTAQITIAKGRNVGIGSFICGFIPELTKFHDLNPSQLPTGNSVESKDDNPF